MYNSGVRENFEVPDGYRLVRKPEFFMLTYLKSIKLLYELESVVAFKVFFRLCELAEFSSGRIDLDKVSQWIHKDPDISDEQLSDGLKELEEKNLVKKLSQNEYLLNPALVWKGKLSRRSEVLQEF